MGRCKQADHCGSTAWCTTTGECLKAQPAPQDAGHQAMWPQMIAALAAIDAALGLPEDGCNSLAQTLEKIRRLRAVEDKANSYIVDNARLAEDAARYRWLRDNTHPENMRKLFSGCPVASDLGPNPWLLATRCQ